MSEDSAAERLEDLEALLDELILENEDCPVLVEGEKDVAALREVGLQGEVVRVKGAESVFGTCEALARRHRRVIILTDWDRGGGHLARLLTEALEANGVRYDLAYRRALAHATKKEIAAVEGLARYLGNLRLAARKHPGRRPKG